MLQTRKRKKKKKRKKKNLHRRPWCSRRRNEVGILVGIPTFLLLDLFRLMTL